METFPETADRMDARLTPLQQGVRRGLDVCDIDNDRDGFRPAVGSQLRLIKS